MALTAQSARTLTKLPGVTPVFEENLGQAERSILFLARDTRGTLAITRTGARVTLVRRDRFQEPEMAEVELRFPGANCTSVRGEAKLASHTNLLLGNNPGKWTQQAGHFAGVRVPGAHPGIDLVFHARRGIVEFDFELAPGADAAMARFQFPGRTPRLLPDGSLKVTTEAGDLVLPKPMVYQGGDTIVESRFLLSGSEARFALGAYDGTKKLTIDPALAYVTYLGGSADDSATGMALDAQGNI